MPGVRCFVPTDLFGHCFRLKGLLPALDFPGVSYLFPTDLFGDCLRLKDLLPALDFPDHPLYAYEMLSTIKSRCRLHAPEIQNVRSS